MKKCLWLLLLPSAIWAAGQVQIFQTATVGSGNIIITNGSGSNVGQVVVTTANPNGQSYTNIQHKSCNTASATGTCAYASNVTAHSTLIVGCIGSAITAGDHSFLVSDNQSDVYSTAAVVGTASDVGTKLVGVYYALNAVGGATTVTCQDLSGGASWIQEAIHEYGTANGGRFDIASSSSPVAAITNPTATPIVTTLNNEFVFAFAGNMGGAASGQSGTLRENYVNNAYQASEDTVVATAGSYTSTFTQGSTSNWVMIQAAFK